MDVYDYLIYCCHKLRLLHVTYQLIEFMKTVVQH